MAWFVALSHVRTLDGLALIDLISNKIKASELATKELDWLRRAQGLEVEDQGDCMKMNNVIITVEYA